MIPVGTTQTYIAAGWGGFRFREVDVGATATFHLYGTSHPSVTIPFTVGEAINPALLVALIAEVEEDFPHADGIGRAFWGWFTDEALNAENRLRNGFRRPTVGTEGFDLNAPITFEIFNALQVDGNIDLYAIWILWGDLNDDDEVCFQDLMLLQSYLVGAPGIVLGVRP